VCDIHTNLYIVCDIHTNLYIVCDIHTNLYIVCDIHTNLYIVCDIHTNLYSHFVLKPLFYIPKLWHNQLLISPLCDWTTSS